MKWRVRFKARKLGAGGAFDRYSRVVEAETKDEAILKLYDEFEHVSIEGIGLEALE